MTQIESPEERMEIRKWAWLMFMRSEKYFKGKEKQEQTEKKQKPTRNKQQINTINTINTKETTKQKENFIRQGKK